jgi:biopolymer transport protein ExbD
VEDAPGKGLDVPGPEALFNMASRIVDRDPERTFLLRIDATVRYAVVDDVLETLRRAGVRNVVFGARPESAGA